ncbi:hypothetical protein QBC41DRAFT_316877 [Cercophora samala]|uniref:F-box domain-containing protein n=1 Tax=Cercophora samala TaxID=330535 RepID=A0AA39ZH49_9PEZI|nr:hypothetical protein QBC41DRAFT_316877 [Cercophora samala]
MGIKRSSISVADNEMDTSTRTPYLPPEIWLVILDILTPTFFQKDISRLTICKQWYYLIIPQLYNKIEYTPKVITRIARNKNPVMVKKLARLSESLHTLAIVLRAPDSIETDQDLADLKKFYLKLSRFRKLESIRFVANLRNSNGAWPYVNTNGSLPSSSLELLVNGLCRSTSSSPRESVKHSLWSSVTSLDLDLDGTRVTRTGGDTHLCKVLRPLMTRLHTLKIRTHSICPDVIGPLKEGEVYSVRNLRIDLHLPVSKVNPKLNRAGLCIYVHRATRNAGLFAHRQRKYVSPPTRQWYDDTLESAMRRAMRRMASTLPVDGRLELVHLAPSGEVHVWNALTDKCVRDEMVKKFDLGMWLSGEGECFTREQDHLDEKQG